MTEMNVHFIWIFACYFGIQMYFLVFSSKQVQVITDGCGVGTNIKQIRPPIGCAHREIKVCDSGFKCMPFEAKKRLQLTLLNTKPAQ